MTKIILTKIDLQFLAAVPIIQNDLTGMHYNRFGIEVDEDNIFRLHKAGLIICDKKNNSITHWTASPLAKQLFPTVFNPVDL